MRRWAWFGLFAFALMGVTVQVGAATGSGAKVGRISGTYSVTDHCRTSWCAGNDYTGQWTIVQKPGSTKLTGHDNAGNVLSGTTSGASAVWSLRGPTYSFIVHATFNPSRNAFKGTWSDSRHASGSTKGAK
jgi:hypothetical protein